MSGKTINGEYHFRFINTCIYRNRTMKYLVIIAFLLTSCSVTRSGYSQGLHSNSNKAVKAYNQGMESYDYLDYQNAEILFREAVSSDPKFYEAYMMLGELYTKQKKFTDAAANYFTAVKLDSTSYKPVFFSLANAEIMSGDYLNALNHYKTYLRNKGNSEKNRLLAVKNIKNCEFAIEAMKKPVSFNPVSVGSSINTDEDEYWPSITADGQTLMFTRQIYAGNGPLGSTQEDFYLSFLSDSGWGKAFNAGEPLNTKNNEGAQTLSSSGNYMYFTACDRPGGLGSCDIYFSAYNNGRWTIPYNIGAPVNTSSWESTPSVSADGNMLFFSSSRPGGFGGKDLWVSFITDKGKWALPVNLGKTINTEGDEMSPFIHFDGKTLYFASDGRPGMGGFDIYMSRMNDDTTWTQPQNLGYPINTSSDDMGLVIEAGGQKAFFSSKRDNKNGKDIFYFKVDESVRPDPVSYLKGKVTDKETGKLLKADYELINLSTNRVTVKSTTDEEGNFLVCLPSGYNYGINVTKTGYLFFSENFMFEGQHTVMKPLIKRIFLNPAKVGEKMLLANVFYEIDSWELKKESVEELNNLADLLEYNKNLVVEIGGYTDSTGTDDYNLVLSEKRALSVVNYLINKGISSGRLRYKGYGNTSPVGDNITYEGRKLNRRTEAKVIASKP
jgi:outer membrane protein OmpA-like peptidoglycan-associated protein/tetratricopeptide (TPR) repeat protein